MKTKETEILLGGLYNEWVSNLMAYDRQLSHVDANIIQLTKQTSENQNEDYLLLVKEEVIATKKILAQVMIDIEAMRTNSRLDGEAEHVNLTVGEMMLRNKLRDKIRKLEQTTFLLKYRLNQYIEQTA